MPERLLSAIEEIHLIELETFMDDDVACEHEHNGFPPCTTVVTDRIIGYSDTCLCCTAAATFVRDAIAEGIHKCAACNRLLGDCWKVLPA